MVIYNSSDANKSREQLLQENADLRDQVNRNKEHCQELTQELIQLKSNAPPDKSSSPSASAFTERRQMQDAVRESDSWLSAILEQLPAAVGVLNENGQFVITNSRMRSYMQNGNMPSQDPERMGRWSSFDEKGRPIPPEQWPGARALRGEIVSPGLEFLYTAENGERRWMHVSAVPLRHKDIQITDAVAVVQDITELKRTEERLNNLLEQQESRAKQLQNLAAELIEAEERERRRISQVLHDDLQQILAGARMQLQSISGSTSSLPILETIELLLEESIEKCRRISHELHPAVLHHSGLIAGLEWLVRQMDSQFGLEVRLDMNASPRIEHSTLKIFVFRAVQELLFNVVKHAQVQSAQVKIEVLNDDLVITVSDEGQGVRSR